MDNTNDLYYIVAGDEMQKLMHLKFPDRKTIAFREDFSASFFSMSCSVSRRCETAEFFHVKKLDITPPTEVSNFRIVFIVFSPF